MDISRILMTELKLQINDAYPEVWLKLGWKGHKYGIGFKWVRMRYMKVRDQHSIR